jgi:hypothetical protein
MERFVGYSESGNLYTEDDGSKLLRNVGNHI